MHKRDLKKDGADKDTHAGGGAKVRTRHPAVKVSGRGTRDDSGVRDLAGNVLCGDQADGGEGDRVTGVTGMEEAAPEEGDKRGEEEGGGREGAGGREFIRGGGKNVWCIVGNDSAMGEGVISWGRISSCQPGDVTAAPSLCIFSTRKEFKASAVSEGGGDIVYDSEATSIRKRGAADARAGIAEACGSCWSSRRGVHTEGFRRIVTCASSWNVARSAHFVKPLRELPPPMGGVGG